jgi:hypothetical protein
LDVLKIILRFQKELPVENPAPHQNKFEWQGIIHEALVELDLDKLRAKIAEAESAIFNRLQALGETAGGAEERHALQDASNTLLTLKREVLKFPDWRD